MLKVIPIDKTDVDIYQLGMTVGNMLVMYTSEKASNGVSCLCNYFIVINKDTGQHYKVSI